MYRQKAKKVGLTIKIKSNGRKYGKSRKQKIERKRKEMPFFKKKNNSLSISRVLTPYYVDIRVHLHLYTSSNIWTIIPQL